MKDELITISKAVYESERKMRFFGEDAIEVYKKKFNIFIGISIGYLIKSESLSTLFTIFIVMFLLIFSDLLVYSALLPIYLKFLINLSPFVILNNILNDTILVGKSMGQLTLPIFRLCILLFSSFLIAYLSKKLSRENVIQ